MAIFQFWGRYPGLERLHVLNDIIDLSEVMQEPALVLPQLLNNGEFQVLVVGTI